LKTHIIILVCIYLFFNLSSKGQNNSTDTIIVGVYKNSPKIFYDATGEPQGIFIDIIQEIAEQNNWILKFKQGEWDDLFIQLKNGEIDVLPDMAISAERDSLFKLNRIPVLESWLEAFSYKQSNINSVKDLNNKSIGVLKGSIQQQYMEDVIKKNFNIDFTLSLYNDYSASVDALKKGEVEVIIASRFLYFSDIYTKDIITTPIVIRPTQLFFAFSNNVPNEIVNECDKSLSQLINDSQSVYYKSLEKWLKLHHKYVIPSYLIGIIVVILLLLLTFISFSILLKRSVKRRTLELKTRNIELQIANEQLTIVSDEKEATKKKLQEGMDFINDIVRSLPTGLYRLHSPFNAKIQDNGMPEYTFLYCNDALHEMLELENDELIKNPYKILEAIHPDDYKDFIKLNQEVHISNSKFIWEGRLIVNNKIKWCHFESVPRTLDDRSTIWTGIIQDISVRKNTELELMRSEQVFHTLADISPVGIFRTDKTGSTTYVNPKWCKLSGLSFAEAMGDGWLKALHPDDLERVKSGWQNRFVKGLESADDYRFVHSDGTEIWVLGYAVPEISEGKIKGYLGTTTDITERKNTEVLLKQKNIELQASKEKAEESDRLKSAFLANMSHEIRTPMNAICGFSNLLKTTSSESKRKEFVEIINSNSSHLLKIIGDIIEISKIEANQVDVNLTAFSLNNVLNNIITTFTNQANSKQLKLITSYALSNPDDIIICDDLLLKQIIINLLSNSIKFTNEGSVILEYDVKGEYLEFCIKDTGKGIPEESKEMVFERFRQIEENSNYSSRKGTGLGLPIARSYTHLLGGKMWLESIYGEGSAFYFTIPYNKSEDKSNKQEKISSSNDISWPHSKILIVEDDVSNFELLKSLLELTDTEILWAENGKNAIEQCNKNRNIDLILMDMKLPDDNGVSIAQKIRKIIPGIPVIAQTAYAFSTDKEFAIKNGIDVYLTKPIDVNLLLSSISSLLKK